MAAINLREQICGWVQDEIERIALGEDFAFDVTMAAIRTPQGANMIQYVIVIFMPHPLDSPVPLLGNVPLLGQPAQPQLPLTFIGAFPEPQPAQDSVARMTEKGLHDLRELAAKMLASQNGAGK